MNTCTHTYALLNLIWCDLIRYCNTYLPIHFNRTFRPASLYKHHAFQQVFLQYPLSVNNNKIWQRCTPHGMASMDDESSDSPHRQKKKPVESTFHSQRALVPTPVETCRTKRRPWRRDDVIRDRRSQAGEAKCQVTSERVRRKTPYIYQLAHITGTHALRTMPLASMHWITHEWHGQPHYY